MAALVIVMAIASAFGLVPMLFLTPPLIVSVLGRRFGSSAVRAVVHEDESLTLGSSEIAREDIKDVWLEDDGTTPITVVAYGDDYALAPLMFENRPQALRFRRAFEQLPQLVAGYRPRKVDLLIPLRFVALAAAFAAQHSWIGTSVVVFFVMGAWPWLQAKQLVVRGDVISIVGALGAVRFKYDELEKVDVDEGILTLKDGRTFVFARANARDRHLTMPMWTDSLRRRVLKAIDPSEQKAEGPVETTDPSS